MGITVRRGRPPVTVDVTDSRYRRIVVQRDLRVKVEEAARQQVEAARRAEWAQALDEVAAGLPVKSVARALGVDPATASRGLRQARRSGQPDGAR